MIRAKTGHRHEINYEYFVGNGVSKIRATCICGGMDAPARFAKEKAEEDGHDHLAVATQKGKPPKRGK
jgi:hypothetical protein